mmetsp:Transcript_129319/g.258209  ORF Transcript_129319/g.258209 Transcript_129319/m.258209 type:complete len:182 (-) Transcript_129319:90-635(-)
MSSTPTKRCDQCSELYCGFGTTCASCRKKPFKRGAFCGWGLSLRDRCTACLERVYATEKVSIEGATFHKNCFRCVTCNRKLESQYEKSELGFFCPTHFKQIAKVTGGYRLGTGPTRSSTTADLVGAMTGRGGDACAKDTCGVLAFLDDPTLPPFTPLVPLALDCEGEINDTASVVSATLDV